MSLVNDRFNLRLYGPLEYYKYIIGDREIHLFGDYHGGLFYQCGNEGPVYNSPIIQKALNTINMANSWYYSKQDIINNLHHHITNLKSNPENEYIISDWLAMIAKSSQECVDIFIERNISTEYFDEYGLGDFDPSYLISLWSIFFMCGKGDKFNGYKHICKTVYPSARFHDIDLRQFEYDIKLSEKSTDKYKKDQDDILRRLTTFIMTITSDSSDYEVPFKYNNISEKHFYDSMITLVKKQYNKSIFSNDVDGFRKAVLDLSIKDLSNYSWQETIFGGIQQYAMDIYLFCRLFISEGNWVKRDDDYKYPTSERCHNSTFPRLSFVYVGFEHTTIYNKFIANYFNVDPIISKNDSHDVRCITFDESPINFQFNDN